MKFKLKWRGKLVFEIFTLLFLFSGMAQATVNGSISISGNGGTYKVLDDSNATMTPNPETVAPTNFLFFNSSPAPNAAATTFAPSGYSTYRSAGDFDVFRYDFAGTGNVYVLALAGDGLHYKIVNTGNYYTGTAWASSNLALSATEAKDYFISGTTDHLKGAPYAPTLSIQEAQTRIGETNNTETTLTIRVSAVPGASPNIIEVGGASSTYAVEIVKVGDAAPVAVRAADGVIGPSLINKSSGTFTLTGSYFVAGATYSIRAWNRNWFSSTDDAANKIADEWTLLGGSGIPGTLSTTINFINGLNFFALGMPAGGLGNWYVGTTGFNTVGELIAVLGGPTRVSTFGYVDNDGNIIGVKVNAAETGFEGSLLLNTPLSATQGYQVYMKGLTVPLVATISNVSQ